MLRPDPLLQPLRAAELERWAVEPLSYLQELSYNSSS